MEKGHVMDLSLEHPPSHVLVIEVALNQISQSKQMDFWTVRDLRAARMRPFRVQELVQQSPFNSPDVSHFTRHRFIVESRIFVTFIYWHQQRVMALLYATVSATSSAWGTLAAQVCLVQSLCFLILSCILAHCLH